MFRQRTLLGSQGSSFSLTGPVHLHKSCTTAADGQPVSKPGRVIVFGDQEGCEVQGCDLDWVASLASKARLRWNVEDWSSVTGGSRKLLLYPSALTQSADMQRLRRAIRHAFRFGIGLIQAEEGALDARRCAQWSLDGQHSCCQSLSYGDTGQLGCERRTNTAKSGAQGLSTSVVGRGAHFLRPGWERTFFGCT